VRDRVAAGDGAVVQHGGVDAEIGVPAGAAKLGHDGEVVVAALGRGLGRAAAADRLVDAQPHGADDDLPGYGYAEAPKAKVAAWQTLLRAYLAGRATLARAFVLIDARTGAKPADEETMTGLDRAAVPFQCVLTKLDKVKAGEHATVVERLGSRLTAHPAAFPEIAATSSETGAGIPTLRAIIHALMTR